MKQLFEKHKFSRLTCVEHALIDLALVISKLAVDRADQVKMTERKTMTSKDEQGKKGKFYGGVERRRGNDEE